jgi:hypothetical protein
MSILCDISEQDIRPTMDEIRPRFALITTKQLMDEAVE